MGATRSCHFYSLRIPIFLILTHQKHNKQLQFCHQQKYSLLNNRKQKNLVHKEMLPNPKAIHFSLKAHSPLLLPPQLHSSPNSQPFSAIKQCCKISRRQLAVFGNSSLLLLLCSQIIKPVSIARAEEDLRDTIQSNQQEEGVSDTLQETNKKSELEETVSDTLQETSDKKQQEETASDTSPEIIDKSQSEESVSDSQETTEKDQLAESVSHSGSNCGSKTITTKAFLDTSIDGEPAGRIVIGLYGKDVPAGAIRFSNLASGAAGISYRRKEFIKIMPNYVQHGGVRSYGVDVELASRTGSDLAAETLIDEWTRQYENCPGTKNLAGTVSIIVRDPSKPPPKLKLVARQGRLEIDQEEVGKNPNGTEFVIAVKDSPELDASALVIGRVLEGMEVVRRIGQVKTVQENTSSPYFRVAKLIGDKRAVVAERGFNRPYSKVLVTNCGLIN